MQNTSENYKEELKNTKKITSGNLFKVILSILLPLFLYQLLNFTYDVFDTFILSVSGVGSVQSVVILKEIKSMVATLGAGIITGAIVLIAKNVGAKKLETANKYLNTTFYFILTLSLVTIFVLIPFAPAFLALLNTPSDVVASSTGYFVVQVVIIGIELFNSMFIGTQKIKGKAKSLFYLNLMVISIKIGLSLLFVYGGFSGVNATWLAIATLIAQLSLLLFAIPNLFKKDSIIQVKAKFKIYKNYLKDILKLGIPIFIGNFVFHLAKVYINAELSEFYGSYTIAAVGLVGLICNISERFYNASYSATVIVVSQNNGKNLKNRVSTAFLITLGLNLAVTAINILVLSIFNESILSFLLGNNQQNLTILTTIFKIYVYQLIPGAIISACEALMEGLGKANYLMFNDILRTLILRIPLLYILYYGYHVGYTTAPLLYLLSNGIASVIILGMALYFLFKTFKAKPKQPLTPNVIPDNAQVAV